MVGAGSLLRMARPVNPGPTIRGFFMGRILVSENGYIKLWRKSQHSAVWKSPDLWYLWSWCLFRASHTRRWITVRTGKGVTEVEIHPGQFIFGRNAAASELGVKPTTIRKRMLRLQKLGNVDMQSDTHFTLVTICNWEQYQISKYEKGQPTGQAGDRQVTTKGQAGDTNKKVENGKNGKNKRLAPPEVHEVSKYCLERGYSVDAQAFIDHYDSNGWKVGRNNMRDWKAAVRGWERRDKEKAQSDHKNTTVQGHYKYEDDSPAYEANMKRELEREGLQ